MNIDFHVHSKITSNFDFEPSYISDYVKEGKTVGLDAFVISEHCHAKNFETAYRYIDGMYKRTGDSYNIDDMMVFTGIEVTTAEKFDVVIIANIDMIFDLKYKIDKIISRSKWDFISIGKLFEIIERDKSIVILAHPYRRFDTFPNIESNIFEEIDAVEMNATDLFKFGISKMQIRIDELGAKLNKNITAGSDAHHPLQIGSVATRMVGKFDNILDMKNEIASGNVEYDIAKEFRVKVQGARLIKKILCGKE